MRSRRRLDFGLRDLGRRHLRRNRLCLAGRWRRRRNVGRAIRLVGHLHVSLKRNARLVGGHSCVAMGLTGGVRPRSCPCPCPDSTGAVPVLGPVLWASGAGAGAAVARAAAAHAAVATGSATGFSCSWFLSPRTQCGGRDDRRPIKTRRGETGLLTLSI